MPATDGGVPGGALRNSDPENSSFFMRELLKQHQAHNELVVSTMQEGFRNQSHDMVNAIADMGKLAPPRWAFPAIAVSSLIAAVTLIAFMLALNSSRDGIDPRPAAEAASLIGHTVPTVTTTTVTSPEAAPVTTTIVSPGPAPTLASPATEPVQE